MPVRDTLPLTPAARDFYGSRKLLSALPTPSQPSTPLPPPTTLTTDGSPPLQTTPPPGLQLSSPNPFYRYDTDSRPLTPPPPKPLALMLYKNYPTSSKMQREEEFGYFDEEGFHMEATIAIADEEKGEVLATLPGNDAIIEADSGNDKKEKKKKVLEAIEQVEGVLGAKDAEHVIAALKADGPMITEEELDVYQKNLLERLKKALTYIRARTQRQCGMRDTMVVFPVNDVDDNTLARWLLRRVTFTEKEEIWRKAKEEEEEVEIVPVKLEFYSERPGHPGQTCRLVGCGIRHRRLRTKLEELFVNALKDQWKTFAHSDWKNTPDFVSVVQNPVVETKHDPEKLYRFQLDGGLAFKDAEVPWLVFDIVLVDTWIELQKRRNELLLGADGKVRVYMVFELLTSKSYRARERERAELREIEWKPTALDKSIMDRTGEIVHAQIWAWTTRPKKDYRDQLEVVPLNRTEPRMIVWPVKKEGDLVVLLEDVVGPMIAPKGPLKWTKSEAMKMLRIKMMDIWDAISWTNDHWPQSGPNPRGDNWRPPGTTV